MSRERSKCCDAEVKEKKGAEGTPREDKTIAWICQECGQPCMTYLLGGQR